jgi:hypothetical protein
LIVAIDFRQYTNAYEDDDLDLLTGEAQATLISEWLEYLVTNDPTCARIIVNWCETHTAKAEAEDLDEGVQRMSHEDYLTYYMNEFYERIVIALRGRRRGE